MKRTAKNKRTPTAAINDSYGQSAALPKKDMDIIVQLAQEFKDRSRRDVQDWNYAAGMAENPLNPRWYLIQDFYDYIDTDGHLESQFLIMRATVRSTPFVMRDKVLNKTDGTVTDLLKGEWFFNLMGDLLESIPYAYTGTQFINPKTMDYKLIPRRNIDPANRRIYVSVSGMEYYDMDDPAILPNLVFCRHGRKLGLLNIIARDLIWKKNSRESWAEFSEKFGIPLVTATTATRDKKELQRIEQMLKMMGEAATAVLPMGSTITVHDSAAKGDPYQIYLQQVKLCNEEISKCILGGTMVSDNGSSRSQGEVHERTMETIGEERKIFLEFIINKQVLPIARKHGLAIPESYEFAFDRSEKLTAAEQWKIVMDMITQGFEIPIAWLSERFGVPITGRKDPVAASVPKGDEPEPEGEPEPKTPKTPKKGKAVKANFNQPSNELALALEGKGVRLPNYKIGCGHAHAENQAHPTADFLEEFLSDLSEQLILDIFEGKDSLITEVLKSIATHKHLTEGLTNSWTDRQTLSWDAPDIQALSVMEYNLFEFSRLKESSNVIALNHLLKDGDNKKPWIEFRNEAQQYLKNPDIKNLKTEYNFTIATGQNGRAYLKFYADKDTITKFVQWQTVGDDHVRLKHQMMDGLVFNIETLTFWLPIEWGCRCEFIQFLGTPTVAQLYTNQQGIDILGIGGTKWNVNRAKEQQVFMANELYMKKLNLTSEMNKLTYDKYGLLPIDKMTGNPVLNLDKSITGANVNELFKPIGNKGEASNYMQFKDYLGRQLLLKKSVFDFHTKGKYLNADELRHQIMPHITDIINNPDEVYFYKYEKGSKTKFQTNYIKHFDNGQSIVVNTGTKKNGVEINTWFTIKQKEDEVRRGYLIKQKK